MLQIGNCYVIDFSKVSDRIFLNLNIKSRDSKRYIDLQLINNSNVVNLSNYTIAVKAIKQDGNIIFNDIEKINVESGRCRMEITPQMLATGDKLPCEIILYGSDGTIASTSDFTLNIIKSSGDKEIISTSEFTALSEALKTVASIENINTEIDTINNELYNSNLLRSTDFSNGETDGKHWYKLPGGLLIQRGSLPVMFYASDKKCKGYIYFPVPFASSDYTFTGNVAENNFTGYADVVCSVKADNKSRGYIEARNIDGHAPGEGKIITVNWIAIGRY